MGEIDMLPKKPDRDKTYWKVTNSRECHHGLQYKTGLIVDPEPFNNNPNESCVPGGIYFTTKKYLHKFFWIGHNLRPVKIPKDARVVLDPEGDKYRADKIILGEKKDLNYYFDYLFDKKTFLKKDCWYLPEYCPKHFDKWFDKKTFYKKDYRYLAECCPEHFDKWFDKETFPKEDYDFLAIYCSKHFDRWFDKETFPKKYKVVLRDHCKDYKHIWEGN